MLLLQEAFFLFKPKNREIRIFNLYVTPTRITKE